MLARPRTLPVGFIQPCLPIKAPTPTGAAWLHEIKHDATGLWPGATPWASAVFQHACKMGLEGIVSKRLGSRYRSGRSPDWLKFKNPAAPAVRREAEEDGPVTRA
jgi:hypothetical protein